MHDAINKVQETSSKMWDLAIMKIKQERKQGDGVSTFKWKYG